jgi:hypothetical protein
MGDPQTAEEVSSRVVAARRRASRERQEKLESALAELEKIRAIKQGAESKAEARVSESDPECRIMKQGNGGYVPGYNVQISTDAVAGIIVGVGVTQATTDHNELVPAVERIEKNLEKKPAQIVADGGFASRSNIIEMDTRGVDYIGSMQDGSVQSAMQFDRRGIDPSFRPSAFSYDTETDTYTCPCNKKLRPVGRKILPGRINYRYQADGADCQVCSRKESCCPQTFSQGRRIERGEDHLAVTAFLEKMQTEEAKQIYRQRSGVAEFSNAWLKTKNGLREFRVRGMLKAGMEVLWACLTYNIQQWIRLRWKIRTMAIPSAG